MDPLVGDGARNGCDRWRVVAGTVVFHVVSKAATAGGARPRRRSGVRGFADGREDWKTGFTPLELP